MGVSLPVMSRILIGISGWSYLSWRGPFFPKNVMVKHHLQYYATQFSATELNGVFYRTPTVGAVRGWRGNTPDDFVFAWKASKFITPVCRWCWCGLCSATYVSTEDRAWRKSRLICM
jgi:uncharacterized protein YecE (DUF72 family)